MTNVKRTLEEQVEYLTRQVENLTGAMQKDHNEEVDVLNKSRASFVEQFQLEMIKPKLDFILLNDKAVVPFRASKGAAGFDMTATQIRYIGIDRDLDADELDSEVAVKLVVKTGVSVKIPDGYIGLLVSRSSIHKTGLQLANGVGVIDSDYTGELMFVFNVFQQEGFVNNWYSEGDRVGQLLVVKDPQFELNQVESHVATERGDGGFGSTGQ